MHLGTFVNNEDTCDEGLGTGVRKGCKADCTGNETGWDCFGYQTLKMTCTPKCGDGLLVGDFTGGIDSCDEGASSTNPGCTTDCKGAKTGFSCSPTSTAPTSCTPICGDGFHLGTFVANSDKCDEGLGIGVNKGCKSDCTGSILGWNCNGYPILKMTCEPICGDGLHVGDFVGGVDTCDEGASPANPGCKTDCTAALPEYDCSTSTTAPTVCVPKCGDGIHIGNFVNGVDTCDEGLGVGVNHGCKPDCTGIILGWNCTGYPTSKMTCAPICKDGILVGNETCDHGANPSNKGC
jgi:hypothetical protein